MREKASVRLDLHAALDALAARRLISALETMRFYYHFSYAKSIHTRVSLRSLHILSILLLVARSLCDSLQLSCCPHLIPTTNTGTNRIRNHTRRCLELHARGLLLYVLAASQGEHLIVLGLIN